MFVWSYSRIGGHPPLCQPAFGVKWKRGIKQMKVSGHCVLATDCWPNGASRVVKLLGVHMLKEQCRRQPRNDVRLVDDTPGGQAEAVEDGDQIMIPNAGRGKRIKHRISGRASSQQRSRWRVALQGFGRSPRSWAPSQPHPAFCCVTPEMFGDLCRKAPGDQRIERHKSTDRKRSHPGTGLKRARGDALKCRLSVTVDVVQSRRAGRRRLEAV